VASATVSASVESGDALPFLAADLGTASASVERGNALSPRRGKTAPRRVDADDLLARGEVLVPPPYDKALELLQPRGRGSLSLGLGRFCCDPLYWEAIM